MQSLWKKRWEESEAQASLLGHRESPRHLRDGNDCVASFHDSTLQFAKHSTYLKGLCSFPTVSPRMR